MFSDFLLSISKPSSDWLPIVHKRFKWHLGGTYATEKKLSETQQ